MNKFEKVAPPLVEIPRDLIQKFDKLGPRYTSYPTADRFKPEFHTENFIQAVEQRNQSSSKPPLSLYIHIPFCAQLCYYCACNKVITKDRGRARPYLDNLKKEIDLTLQHFTQRESLSQIHLGGGTPTFLSDDEMAELMSHIRARFDIDTDAEISIEVDPRTVTDASIEHLSTLGFNRTSLGVQDFDPAVQAAVHRIQSYEMVAQTLATCRKFGMQSINFDLIYGLPKQDIDSFSQTLDRVIDLSPDRIALYNYAHLPERFKPQRRINELDLPSAEERLNIFMMSLKRLQEAGYVYIGLDHFAKPNDSLARAALNGSLHRNFQGYTTRSECDLIAVGLSSIGKIGNIYYQNKKEIEHYYDCLSQNLLPIDKGYILTPDDEMRREIIMQLMCSSTVSFQDIEHVYGIDFSTYFDNELQRLTELAEYQLLDLSSQSIRVSPLGRFFVRAIGMNFDRFLVQNSGAKYSKLI